MLAGGGSRGEAEMAGPAAAAKIKREKEKAGMRRKQIMYMCAIGAAAVMGLTACGGTQETGQTLSLIHI